MRRHGFLRVAFVSELDVATNVCGIQMIEVTMICVSALAGLEQCGGKTGARLCRSLDLCHAGSLNIARSHFFARARETGHRMPIVDRLMWTSIGTTLGHILLEFCATPRQILCYPKASSNLLGRFSNEAPLIGHQHHLITFSKNGRPSRIRKRPNVACRHYCPVSDIFDDGTIVPPQGQSATSQS
jgi:hypothetical protein